MGFIYDVSKSVLKDKIEEAVKDPSKLKDLNNVFNQYNTNSITKMAKSAVQTYPVIVSEGIVANNEDLMFAICSYLETQYAVFTMIAMGMDPIFEGTNARDHVLKFYSGESDNYISGCNPNTLVTMSKEKITITEENLKEYQSIEDNNSFKCKFCSKTFKNSDELSTHIVNDHNKNENLPNISLRNQKLEQKARMSDPTIVNVKLKMASNQHEVEFPIAIKAMPRFITAEESSQIFTYLKEDKPISLFIKLLSGEISLFKDIILQLERAKKDKELYSRLGRHPWFRQLLLRKTSSKVLNFLKSIFSIKKEVSVLPICSLVVTKDELENGFGNVWDKIKSKEEGNILDKLMLLCLTVVDTTTSLVEFSFYGLNGNTIIKADSLIKESKNGKDGKDMENLLKTLVYKL